MIENKKNILKSLEKTLKQTENWEMLETLDYIPESDEVTVRFRSGALYNVKSDCTGIELINRILHVGEGKTKKEI